MAEADGEGSATYCPADPGASLGSCLITDTTCETPVFTKFTNKGTRDIKGDSFESCDGVAPCKAVIAAPTVVLLFISSYVMFVNAFNEYAVEFTCQNEHGTECSKLSNHQRKDADATAASFSTIVLSVPNVLSLLTTAYFSVLSDSQGRRKILIQSTFCVLGGSICSLTAVLFKWPLWSFIPGI